MLPPSSPHSDCYASSPIKNDVIHKHQDTVTRLKSGIYRDTPARAHHIKDSNSNFKYLHPSHIPGSDARCEGNGAVLLDLRMNTNGLERGAMTGSGTTSASESAPWGPYQQDVITTARPHRPLEPGALERGPPPPPIPERTPLILPPSAAPPSDTGIFRPPLNPPSPSSRIFPHEQYPPFTSSSSPSLFTPSPLYPQLPSSFYPSGYPYPGTAGSSLSLGGTYPPVGVGTYAELLVRMGQLPPSASRQVPGSGQQMHLPHHPPISSLRDSPGPRHPLTSHASPVAVRFREPQSRSPEERDVVSGLVSSPFRHPVLPPPGPPRSQQTVKVESSGIAGPYHRPSALKSGPQLPPQPLRVPPGHSGHTVPSELPKYAGPERTIRETSSPKRARLGQGRFSPSTPHQTHSVTSTISTSTAVTSAQSSTPQPSSQPHYPPHFMKGSIIQLANGALKRVEDLRTEDFVNSADISPDLKIDSSQVVHIEEMPERGTVILGFSVGEQKLRVTVEATVEHPFFVLGQGWSSCSPDKTQQRYGLQCFKLVVGDICISLTQKQSTGSSTSQSGSRIELNGQHGAAQSRPPEVEPIPSTSKQSEHCHSEEQGEGQGEGQGGSLRGKTESAHLSGSHESAQESASSSHYVSVDSPAAPLPPGSPGGVDDPPITASSRVRRWSAPDQVSGEDPAGLSMSHRQERDLTTSDLDNPT